MNSTKPEELEPATAMDPLADSAIVSDISPEPGSGSQRGDRRRPWVIAAALTGILLVGLAMRVWIVSTPGLGLQDDLRIFSHWSRHLANDGLARFYATQQFCDYPPLGVLVFYAVGKSTAAIGGGSASEELLHIILKIPACLADLAMALLLFVEARRLLGSRAGLGAAALYFLNPVAFYNSAYWGQVDAIYTFFALLAVVLMARRHWYLAGAAVAAGLLAKFQTIAFVPLLLFETYRLGGWRAIAGKLVAAVALAAVVTTPFTLTGTLGEVLQRGYVNVIGQYKQLSKGAFNTWTLVAPADTTDAAAPVVLTRIAAAGQTEIPAGSSWLLALTWRRISLLIYALSVAVVLAIYSLRPGPIARYAAAALLGLAFFLFLTEMHERYAFPALAFLALWAVSGQWRERAYFLLSALLLMNLTFVLPPGGLAPQIATASLLVFGLILVVLARPQAVHEPSLPPGEPALVPKGIGDEPSLPASQPLIVWFRRATLAAVVIAAGGATSIAVLANRAPGAAAATDVVYLSEIEPVRAQQAWRSLALDRAVAGGPLELGGTIYLRGLGTHAPSRIEYAVPPNATSFRALAGIDHGTGGPGSATIHVEVDGKRVFTSGVLKWQDQPVEIDIPVAGAARLVLRADPTADGQRADHVDWALARFELGTSATTQPSDEGRSEPAEPGAV